MDIHQATEAYETWLGKRLTLIPRRRGAEAPADGGKPIPVPAATFYRWVQRWPEVCPS